jgi:hypothetical protein
LVVAIILEKYLFAGICAGLKKKIQLRVAGVSLKSQPLEKRPLESRQKMLP